MTTTTIQPGLPIDYDSSQFPAFAVTVDVVVLTTVEGRLHVLLVRRAVPPFEGVWALPGGFKRPAESLAEAAQRELLQETSVDGTRMLTQLGSYGDPGRDPRMNVVTVAYLALLRNVEGVVAGTDAAATALVPASDVLNGTVDLAFDHTRIVRDAVAFVEARPWIAEGDASAGHETARGLATVLFTDIVDSTRTAATVGDRRWRELMAAFRSSARAAFAAHGGWEIDAAGDGFFATFDLPARAVECALEICASARRLGLEVRAGCHTGEVERSPDGVSGIAVHIGARIAALAGPAEVLVSRTVRDLTAGTGIVFTPAGEHELKGVPERWTLYRVES